MCGCNGSGKCNCVGALSQEEARMILEKRDFDVRRRRDFLKRLWEITDRILPIEQFEDLTLKELSNRLSSRQIAKALSSFGP